MTRQSRILDKVVKGRYQLEVRALSADMKKPLTLHAVLADYDDDGFLYTGRSEGSLENSEFYVPRAAVAYMRFSQTDSPEPEPDEEKPNTYFFRGVMYDLDKRELSGNGNREFIIGHNQHKILTLLFESTETPIKTRVLCGLQECEEEEKVDEHAQRCLISQISRLRKALNKYGLTIFPVRGTGYILKGVES